MSDLEVTAWVNQKTGCAHLRSACATGNASSIVKRRTIKRSLYEPTDRDSFGYWCGVCASARHRLALWEPGGVEA